MALNLTDSPGGLDPDAGDMRATALGGGQHVSSNLKDALRKKFADLEKTRFGDFEVPGYDGLLIARYRRLTTEEVVALASGVDNVNGSDRRAVARASSALNADFLGAACQELFAKGSDGALQPLGEEYPLKFDMHFADFMGFEVSTEEGIREVVLRAFDHNELALKRHADEVDEWMTSLTVHLDGDSLGE